MKTQSVRPIEPTAVATVAGEVGAIDARRTQLVRLHRRCAKAIWKELKAAAKRETPLSV